MNKLFSIILSLLLLTTALPLAATESGVSVEEESGWQIDHWRISFSFYTKHFDPEPEHNDRQKLIAVEPYFRNDWLAGVAVFDNSFGQPSQFVYIGKYWPIMNSPHWYVKLMGGLLHGYKEPYEDKIPLNGLGVAPAIVPSLGFRHKRVFVEANLAGAAALTLTAGITF